MRVLFSLLFLIIFQLSSHAFSDGYHLSKVNGKTAIKHVVEKGQTLYFISKKYNTSVSQVRQDNPSINASDIKVGQQIVIYFDKSLLTNVDMVDRSMCRPLIHTVEKGETLYGIAKREYDMDVNQVKSWNNMYDDELRIGQDLIVGWVYSDTSASAVYDNQQVGTYNSYTQTSTSDPYSTTTYTSETYTAPSSTTNDNAIVTEYVGEYTSGTNTSTYTNPTSTTTTTTYSAPSTSQTYTAPSSINSTAYVAPSTSTTSTYVAPSTSTTSTYSAPSTSTNSHTSPVTNNNPEYLKTDTEVFIKSDSQNAIYSNPVSNTVNSRPGASVDLSDKPVYIGTVNSNRPGVVSMNGSSNKTTVTNNETTAMVSKPVTPVAEPAVSVDYSNSKKLARTIFFEQQMDKTGNYVVKNEKGAASWFEQDNKGTELYAMHKTAPVGTVLKITNPVSKYTVYAKVVGQLPDTGENSKSLLKLSSTAVELLKAYDKMFMVECEYYLAN